MTIVISDTSPLNYLILIGEIDLLPRLYTQVLIPEAVWQELRDDAAPAVVHDWAFALPAWIRLCELPDSTDRSLDGLDAGERAAILVALSQHDPVLLLMDEERGRKAAARKQIQTTGTLGVLRAAAYRGWVDLADAFRRLRQTNFREPEALMAALLTEDAARKNNPK